MDVMTWLKVNDVNEQLADIIQDELPAVNTSQFTNLLQKLSNREDVLIHCVGDSTTQGTNATGSYDNYVGYLTQMLADKFPHYTVIRFDGKYDTGVNNITIWERKEIQIVTNSPKIVVVRNGIGGNTLLNIINRANNYSGFFTQEGEWRIPDAILLMCGINDSLASNTQRYMPPLEFKKGLYSFVKMINERHSKTDIAFISPCWSDYGTLIPYTDVMREVAISIGIPYVPVHEMWLKHYNASLENYGQGSWLSIDQWHPTNEGYYEIASLCFKTLFSNVGKTYAFNTINKLKYSVENTNPNIIYTGTWNNSTSTYGDINYIEKLSNEVNATIEYSFKGSKIYGYFRRDSTVGSITVEIVGVSGTKTFTLTKTYPQTPIDTIKSYPYDKVLLWDNINGVYTIKITVASGNVAFKGFEILGSVDNYKLINTPIFNKQNAIINSFTVEDVAGTSTLYWKNVTFPIPHNKMPVVILTGNLENCTVYYNKDQLTTGTLPLIVKKNSGNFANEVLVVNVISIG